MASRPSRSVAIVFVLLAVICFVPLWVGAYMQSSTATTTSVSPDNTTITLGDTVKFTATVSAATGTPTGLVTFFDGSTPLGSATLNQANPDQATFSTSLLAVGSHSITAIYDGDTTFSASLLSSATIETVNLRTSTTSPLVLNPTIVVVGQPSTTTVTVTDGGSSAPPGTTDTFTTTGAPATGRTGFTSTLFGDGLVLVTGGTDANNNVLQSAEIYNTNATPTPGFTVTGNLNFGRTGAVAVLLRNGKVLVAGGSSDGSANGALDTAELFDPTGNVGVGTFTLAGSGSSNKMTAPRFGATATLLSNGQVLVAGGEKIVSSSITVLNTAELYDPATDTFTAIGTTMTAARTGHSATLLGTGTVLVAGGSSDGTMNGALSTAELFDPGTGTFTAIMGANSTLIANRWQPETALLLSGKVLIAGGQNSGGTLMSADLFDPTGNGGTGSFTASNNSMAHARANGSAVALPNGMVLLAGGTTNNAVDLYDPESDEFDSTGGLKQFDTGLVSTLLNNGDVLVVGLTTDATPASDAELYAPSFNPLGTVGLGGTQGETSGAACVLTPSTSTTSTCTSTVTALSVGTNPHIITGTYPADAVHSGGSNTASLTVNKADTTTTVTASPGNTTVYGQSVTFTATVTDTSSGSIAVPTGTVQFMVDGNPFGSPVTLTGATATSSTATSQATTTLPVTGSPHPVSAVYSNTDGNFNNGSPGTLSGGQTVTPASTTTAVIASPGNTTIFGQSLTFTATVSNSSAGSTGAPMGKVQFMVDGNPFGSAVTLTGASATSSTATSQATTTLPVTGSPHSVSAVYSNTDGNFNNGSPGTLSGGQTVTPASTTTAVIASPGNTTIFGQSLTFTATVSNSSAGSTGAPMGKVQFMVDGNPFGSAVTLTGASATSSTATSQATTTLPVTGSPHSVSAVYSNTDGNFNNGSPGTLSGGQTVTPASTTTAVIASPGNTTVFGQSLTFTATVSNSSAGSTGAPTGKVQFMVDGNPFGSAVTLTGATATSSTATSQATTTLPVTGSPHSVSAVYSNADGNFNNGSPGALSGGQTVTPASTTTAVIASPGNTTVFGQSLTFTATVSNSSAGSTGAPTGKVQFMVDGNPFGSAVTLTGATATSSTATSQATTTLPVTGSPHPVSAVYSNTDGNFNNGSPGTLSGGQTVTPANTSLAVSSSSNPSTYGQSITFTATVTDTSSGSVASPTGNIQFLVDGSPFGSPVVLGPATSTSSNATSGTLATLIVNAGTAHLVSATYTNSDGNFTSSGTNSLRGGQVVNRAHLTLTADDKSKIYDGITFTAFTATLSGFVLGETDQGLRTLGSLSGNAAFAGPAVSGINVNTYTIAPNQGTLAAANYDFPGTVNGTLTVNPAHLAVTADNQTKIYNALPFTAFTATLSGFVHGETDAALRSLGTLSGNAAFTGPAVTGVNAGPYTIIPTIGTLLARNYDFPPANFNTGGLTISKANTTSLTTGVPTPINDPVNGASFSFVVVVTSATGGTPTGSVKFIDDKNSLNSLNPVDVSNCPPGTPAIASCAKFSPAIGQLASGAQTITATYQGDGNFNPASGNMVSSVVVTTLPAVNTSPGQTIASQTVTFENAAALAGQNISLSCNVQAAIIPASTLFPKCSLNPSTLPSSGSITVSLSTTLANSAAVNGTSAIVASADRKGIRSHPLAFAVFSVPAIGLLGVVLLTGTKRSRSRRRGTTLLVLMLMLFVFLLAVGCGGGFNNPNNQQPPITGSTPTGTYLVSVIGTDATPNHNQVVVATIPLNVQF